MTKTYYFVNDKTYYYILFRIKRQRLISWTKNFFGKCKISILDFSLKNVMEIKWKNLIKCESSFYTPCT